MVYEWNMDGMLIMEYTYIYICLYICMGGIGLNGIYNGIN